MSRSDLLSLSATKSHSRKPLPSLGFLIQTSVYVGVLNTPNRSVREPFDYAELPLKYSHGFADCAPHRQLFIKKVAINSVSSVTSELNRHIH